MTKVFIDGSAGTTGLRIYERLEERNDIELIRLPEELRKDSGARKAAINSADIAFLCLPDAAAKEAVSLVDIDDTVIIDTSTAHRTSPGWVYGFPELSEEIEKKIAVSRRIAVPGCHASGFIALVFPLIEAEIIDGDALLTCFSVTGYSGGGKKMISEYESRERDPLLSAPRQYGITQTHKHLPEMTAVCGLKNQPVFSPVVADYYSGMAVTVPLFRSAINGTAEDIRKIYKADSDLMNTNVNMFEDLPEIFHESALLDRFHGFIKGWEVPKMKESLKANGWALNTEYFGEILHMLRNELSYRAVVDQLLQLPKNSATRDTEAIKRICTGFLKLIFPNATDVSKVNVDEFERYCLQPALEMRGVIKTQLGIIDSGEFGGMTIPDITIKEQYREK